MGDPPGSSGSDRPTPAVERLPDLPFATGGSALSELRAEITGFVAEQVDRAGADRVVVPMNGGLETTTALLAAEALGPERVLGVSLPAGTADTDVAAVGDEAGIEVAETDLSVLIDVFEDSVAPALSTDPDRDAVGNAFARLRMAATYFAAETRDGLVCGGATRTDRLLDRPTKHGDGAADLFPLGSCWTTEACALARLIGVPPRVLERGPTTALLPDGTDDPGFEAAHGFVDVVLHLLIDVDLGVEGAAAELGVDADEVERIARRHLDSRDRRRRPPTPADGRDPAGGFHGPESDRGGNEGEDGSGG